VESEFPGNSRRGAPTPTPKEESEKKVEVVVTSEVVRRKRPVGKRLVETFLGGSAREVVQYVLMDVMLPAAKDMFADAVSQGVERLIFGETRSVSRRPSSFRGTGNATYTSYNRMSSTSSNSALPPRRTAGPSPISQQSRREHDFDEIILATRAEAEMVYSKLQDLIDRYQMVSVADLYSLVGVSASYTDEKWGWTDLHDAKIAFTRGGYRLDLPRTEQIS
jgi:hypothetical protein